jgi:8-oxo-dGTP pyrophosphatase MutT (NUDIX family)
MTVDPRHDGGVLGSVPWELRDVAGLLVTGDGRYLMQLRDDFPWLRVPDHWSLFGGRVEEGETPRQALLRELVEELEFTPRTEARWFTETGFVMPQLGVAATRKVFFEVDITEADIAAMVQHEGAGLRLFTVEDLLAQPRVVPWDLHAVILHARRDTIFRAPETEPPRTDPPEGTGG